MFDNFKLQDKTIVITGASSGIGRQCAITCAKMGANVIILGRNEIELNKTKGLCPSDVEVFSACIDITDYSGLEGVIKEAVSIFGKIDGFIHSAGIGMTKPLKLLKLIDYELVMKVNVFSAFELVKILSKKKYLKETGASYILISSVMGLLGDIGNVAYCSSKGALLSAGKAAALELASKKIRVNCVLPGVVETEMAKELFETISPEAKEALLSTHPLGFGSPVDVANSCVFLLSDASRWITGTNFVVDGGYSSH